MKAKARDGGNRENCVLRLAMSFNSHKRAYLAESFVADPGNEHQVLDATERAISFTMLDDPASERFAYVRDLLQFLQRCGVDVNGVRKRLGKLNCRLRLPTSEDQSRGSKQDNAGDAVRHRQRVCAKNYSNANGKPGGFDLSNRPCVP